MPADGRQDLTGCLKGLKNKNSQKKKKKRPSSSNVLVQ
jgi:hypothetical protein